MTKKKVTYSSNNVLSNPQVFEQFITLPEIQSIPNLVDLVISSSDPANFFTEAKNNGTYLNSWNDQNYSPAYDTAMDDLQDAQNRLSNIQTNPNFSSLASIGNASSEFYTLIFTLLYPAITDPADEIIQGAGVSSSFDVTAYNPSEFVEAFASFFGPNEGSQLASAFYNSASNIRSAVMRQYFNIQSSVQQGRVVPYNNLGNKANSNYANLPNYNQLFGEENYISVNHDESVLSPSAYLVELENMRQKYEQNSLVSYWSFNGGFDNQVIKFDSGAINGDCSFTDDVPPIQYVSQALSIQNDDMENPDSWISIPTYPAFNFGANDNFTISLWVKPDATQPGTNNDVGDSEIISLQGLDRFSYSYAIRVFNQRATAAEQGKAWVGRYDGTNNPFLVSDTRIDDGNYHHIAFVKRGKMLYLFVDGIQNGDPVLDTTTSGISNPAPLTVGRRGPNQANFFTGNVSDFGIFNEGLEDEEIGLLEKSSIGSFAFVTTLPKRRPDLFEIPLTPENTNTEVPTIDIVNNALEVQLQNFPPYEGSSKSIQEILSEDLVYPLETPFNYNQQQINSALSLLSTKLPVLVSKAQNPEAPINLTWQYWNMSANMSAKVMAVNIDHLTITWEQVMRFFGLPESTTAAEFTPYLFQQQTKTTAKELAELLYGDLNSEEVEAELNNTFYVNYFLLDQGAKPLGIKETDGQFEFIGGFNSDWFAWMLGRANKLVRLSEISGINYTNLNWILQNITIYMTRNSQSTDLLSTYFDQTYELIAGIQQIQDEFNLSSINEAVALVGFIKYQGKQYGKTMLESIFGMNVANWSDWNIADQDGTNGAITSSIMKGLKIDYDELLELVNYIAPLYGLESTTSIDLSQAPFSFLNALYRGAKFSQINSISVSELIFLLESQNVNYLLLTANMDDKASIINQLLIDFNSLTSFIDLLSSNAISVADYQKMRNLKSNATNEALVNNLDIQNLIQEVGDQVTQDVLLNQANFSKALQDLGQSIETSSNAGIDYTAAYQELIALYYVDHAVDSNNNSIDVGVVLESSVSDEDAKSIASAGNFKASNVAAKSQHAVIAGMLQNILETHQQKQNYIINSVLQYNLALNAEQAGTVAEWGKLFLRNEETKKEDLAKVNALHVYYTEMLYPTADLSDQKNFYTAQIRLADFVLAKDLNEAELRQILDGYTDYIAPDLVADFGIDSKVITQWINMDQLAKQYSTSDNSMLRLLRKGAHSVAELSETTGWNQNDILSIMTAWNISVDTEGYTMNTPVASTLAMSELFEYSDETALSIEVLLSYSHQFSKDDNGSVVGVGNDALATLTDQTTNAIAIVNPKQSASAIDNSLIIPLKQSYRNVLVDSVLSAYQNSEIPSLENIQDINALSQYLLLDLNVTAKPRTSKIQSALLSYQIYFSRTIDNLEQGISMSPYFVESIWPAYRNYRMWEANRKIFLYPENYLNPNLTSTTSDAYTQLQETILQGAVNEESIDSAFSTYLKNFGELANLKIMGSYMSTPDSEGRCELQLISYSSTAKVYYSSISKFNFNSTSLSYELVSWGSWKVLNISIPSENISLIFAFDRLFLLWIEFMNAEAPENASSKPNYQYYQATIRYSYYQVNDAWSEAADLSSFYTQFNNIEFSANTGKPLQNGVANPSSFSVSDYATYMDQFAVLNLTNGFYEEGSPAILLSYQFPNPDPTGDELFFACQLTDNLNTVDIDLPDNVNSQNNVLEPFESTYFQGFGINLSNEASVSTYSGNLKLWDKNGGKSKSNFDLTPNGPSIDINQPEAIIAESLASYQLDFQSGAIYFDGETFYANTNKHPVNYVKNSFWFNIQQVDSSKDRTSLLSTIAHIPNAIPFPIVSYLHDEGSIILNSSENSEGYIPFNTANKIEFGQWYYLELTYVNTYNNMPDQLHSAELYERKLDKFNVSYIDLIASIKLPLSIAPNDFFYGIIYGDVDNSEPGSIIDFQNITYISDPNWGGESPKLLSGGYSTEPTVFELPFIDSANNGLVSESVENGNAAAYIMKNYDSDYLALAINQEKTEWRYYRLNSSIWAKFDSEYFQGGIDQLMSVNTQLNTESSFSALGPNLDPNEAQFQNITVPRKYWPVDNSIDLASLNSSLYWELFYQTPLLIAQSYQENGDYESAQKWYQYVFNPQKTTAAIPANSSEYDYLQVDANGEQNIYWNFIGLSTFYDKLLNVESLAASGTEALENFSNEDVSMIASSSGSVFTNNMPNTAVQEYYDDPYNPNTIARLRPKAYQVTAVTNYVQNLISQGDALYEQETAASLSQAYVYYNQAQDLLGVPPQSQGNFSDLQDNSNVTLSTINSTYESYNQPIQSFLVGLEGVLNRIQVGSHQAAAITDYTPYNLISGLYFGIPQNTLVTNLQSTLNSRFYNLRNNLDMNGQPLNLALFEPAINPLMLIQGAASGNLQNAVNNVYNMAAPNYRFYVQLGRANSFAAQTSQFGQLLLSVMQQKDSEGLAQLQINQQSTILEMSLAVKQSQIDAAESNLKAIYSSTASALLQKLYYQGLIEYNVGYPMNGSSTELIQSEDMTVYDEETGVSATFNFNETSNAQNLENQGDNLDVSAITFSTASSAMNYIAAILSFVPNKFGLSTGSPGPAYKASFIAGALSSTSNVLSIGSGLAKTRAGYKRRRQDWEYQLEQAKNQLNQLNDSWDATNSQLEVVKQEYSIMQTQIQQNTEVLNYYKTKFTNEDLYQWMKAQLVQLYRQSFDLAVSAAKEAQTAFEFEKGFEMGSLNIVNANGWNSKYDGLLSTTPLIHSLSNLEKRFMDEDFRRMEITKTISLATLLSSAYEGGSFSDYVSSQMANGGGLVFTITENNLDSNYAGQYCRLIKNVIVSIPTLLGPYENIHATLTQTSNAVVVKDNQSAEATEALITATGGSTGDPSQSMSTPTSPGNGAVIRTIPAPCKSIALSRGMDDTGVLAMSMEDSRYLPFEGTGVISSWNLYINDLDPSVHSGDLSPVKKLDISDIIVTVRYSALVGDANYAQSVVGLYQN